jgi:hypothetical protein
MHDLERGGEGFNCCVNREGGSSIYRSKGRWDALGDAGTLAASLPLWQVQPPHPAPMKVGWPLRQTLTPLLKGVRLGEVQGPRAARLPLELSLADP